MNSTSVSTALVSERKYQAGQDALQDARARGFTAEETRHYIFDAQSNAIWDAQQGRPYTKPTPPRPEPPPGPMYTELGFLNAQAKGATGSSQPPSK